MSPWIRELFLNVLPRLLLMRRPQNRRGDSHPKVAVRTLDGVEIRDPYRHMDDRSYSSGDRLQENYIDATGTGSFMGSTPTTTRRPTKLPPNVHKAMIGVSFIADHLKQQDDFNKVSYEMCIFQKVTG